MQQCNPRNRLSAEKRLGYSYAVTMPQSLGVLMSVANRPTLKLIAATILTIGVTADAMADSNRVAVVAKAN